MSARIGGVDEAPRYSIGVDVGGTFTDVFVVDEGAGRMRVAKVPSTRGDQSIGFLAGIEEALASGAGEGHDPGEGRGDGFGRIATVVHGTTVGTNALLERRGAVTGIITTRGFRDVLEMRRRDRPTTWGLKGGYVSVVPRPLRLEVDERTLADGSILVPVDADQVRDAAARLLAAGCEAVCVFFVNGYANDANERRAVETMRSMWPNAHVTAATELLPEIREFERLSTATLNAYLQPVVSSYLERLEAGLERRGSGADVLIVQSNGGVMSVDAARAQPVRTALSGPAAGVIAASAIARAAGFPNLVTCDMGGTSFDVSLVADGVPALAAQTAIDFGLVIRSPMIEISTIGAGGGSIAWLDASGLLQVGPRSAGADPGPVCYGLGNRSPTVTDANLVLGRIDPERPIGGKLDRLDVEAAREALAREIGTPLGLEVEAAAEAVLRLANAKMAGAIRLVSIEQGHDPGGFVAMPFGGGGALHTGALIREVGLRAALVPRYPGVTSALGCLVADMRTDRVQTVNRTLDALDADALGAAMRETADTLREVLSTSGVRFTGVDVEYSLDMLYVGQTHTVAVPLAGGEVDRDVVQGAFDAAYSAAYGRLLHGIPTRVVNHRVAVIGRRPELDMSVFAPHDGRSAPDCLRTRRPVYADGAWHDAGVYDRLALEVGATVDGPAILDQPDTTVFVDPGLTARVDAFGNLVMTERGERPDRPDRPEGNERFGGSEP